MFSKKDVFTLLFGILVISIAFIISIKIIVGENIPNPAMFNGAIITYFIGIGSTVALLLYGKK
ncbi:MAG: hypothetical protein RSA01_09845 [Clostridium sp.]